MPPLVATAGLVEITTSPLTSSAVTEVPKNFGYAASEAAGLTMLGSDVRLDLLVTDIGLPGGMNGRQMADAARVSRPDLKVLFITGYAENAVLGTRLDAGMQVLTKPFTMEALASRVRALVAAGTADAR